MIAFIVAVLTIMLLQEEHRLEIIATGVLSLLVISAGLIVSRRRKAGRVGAAALG